MLRSYSRSILIALFSAACILLALLGCRALSNFGQTPTASPSARSSPTSCTGWTCTLEGVVYAGEAAPGNELGDVKVTLSQHSNCSPTRGEQEAFTDADGGFAFEVYLHDTDSFKFEVQDEGYQPAALSLGGFDCLFCSCSELEIVLLP